MDQLILFLFVLAIVVWNLLELLPEGPDDLLLSARCNHTDSPMNSLPDAFINQPKWLAAIIALFAILSSKLLKIEIIILGLKWQAVLPHARKPKWRNRLRAKRLL
jgi:hypothetical protein